MIRRIRIPEPRVPRGRARLPFIDIIANEEFAELFDKLFGPIHTYQEEQWQNVPAQDDDGFHWSVNDEDEDREPYLHDKVYSEEDGEEDNDSSIHDIHDDGDGDGDSVSGSLKDEPPSIFDMLASGKEFKDIVAAPQNNDCPHPFTKFPLMYDAKNPFVFIANRLTFLIKTTQPIIWDTSTMATPSEDCIFIAFNQHKNPQLDMRTAAKIAHAVNTDKDIQDEIEEYLEGTDWESIFCAPYIMNLNGEDRLGFVFAVTSREDD